MGTYNLGTCFGAAALLADQELDMLIKAVLEWQDKNGLGLGEIIDRMQHLSACRGIYRDFDGELPACLQTPSTTGTITRRRLNLSRDEIISLRRKGYRFRDIAKIMGCSVGAVHKYAHKCSGTNSDYIIASARILETERLDDEKETPLS